MTRKTHVKINNDVDVRYANWVKMFIDLVAPKNLFLIAGRGTAKTEDIMAERSMRICQDMPGSYLAFLGDTYTNVLKNVTPTLINGWKRKGWKNGIDYVTDAPPPSHFLLPYKQPETYKHTISTRFGNFFGLVSMDVPESAAGNSYQHNFADEVKNIEFEKAKKLMPALRGYPAFGHSIYYRGSTFTTDMPNILEGEYDWILDREKDMNIQQIKDILNIAIVLNDVKKELYNAVCDKDFTKVKNLQRQYYRWLVDWTRARKDSSLFYQVSTFANVDLLTPGYFKDSLESLGPEEFKTSIITLRPTLKKGETFYINLGNHHFYDDGIVASFYDKFNIGDDVQESSLALRYINHNQAIECGIDFGDQCSIVTGQDQGKYVYLLKNFWTLPPESSRELALQFTNFYKHHKTKVLDMYYDRSGNQYSKIRKDWASELKDAIEKQNGLATGWRVNLMSQNQATIMQEEEYTLMKNMLGGYNKDLPQVKIDKFGCRELKSSMEIAKIKIRIKPNGSKTIHKDKSSEALPMQKRPMYSTNMSDALKYFMYRAKWVKIAMKRSIGNMSTPSTY